MFVAFPNRSASLDAWNCRPSICIPAERELLGHVSRTMRKYALASVLALFLIGVCFLLSESFGRTVVFDAPGGVVDIEEGTVRPIVITVSAPKVGSAKIGGGPRRDTAFVRVGSCNLNLDSLS